MGSTRYDSDAYMIMEIDTELQTWRCLNWDCLHWGSHYSSPWTLPA